MNQSKITKQDTTNKVESDKTVEQISKKIITQALTNKVKSDKTIEKISNILNQIPLEILYEIIGELQLKDKLSLKVIKKITEKKLYGWNSPVFENVKNKLTEKDEFIENPPEVVEGIFTCGICKTNKTVSFSKQTRSGDESTTVYITCIQCKKTWTE